MFVLDGHISWTTKSCYYQCWQTIYGQRIQTIFCQHEHHYQNAPVEAHHSIGMIERYYGPLQRVDSIISTEIPGIELDLALQMSFKAINDLVGPDGLVPTLLVFGAYPRMTEMDAPSPSITQRALTMRKAMNKIRRCIASRQNNDVLNTQNRPSTGSVHDLPINSPVLIYLEWNTSQSGV